MPTNLTYIMQVKKKGLFDLPLENSTLAHLIKDSNYKVDVKYHTAVDNLEDDKEKILTNLIYTLVKSAGH